MSRRLRDYQEVTLDVGPAHIRGRVVATDQHSTTVRLDRPLTSTVPERPHVGFLLAEAHPHPVMLDGVVIDDGPGRLRLLLGDRVSWRDRRANPRLTIPLKTIVRGSSGTPMETETLDISAGGALLPVSVSGDVRLEITVPGPAESTTIRASGQVLSRGEGRSAVRFTGIAPQDVAVLERLVVGVRTAIAERFAAKRSAS